MRWLGFALGMMAACGDVQGQEWRHWGGDAGGTRYSPLKQIHRGNVAKLKVAWTYKTGEQSDGTALPFRSTFESTPLMVDGVLYVTTPFANVVALDAETGKELWKFDAGLDRERISGGLYINRGVAYWTDGKQKRLLLGTLGGRLFSIDAATGKADAAFGEQGSVNLRTGIAEKFPNHRVGMTSPPAIYKDLAICGSIVPDGEPKGPAGDVRAYDVRTGKLVWQFHTVPRPGEFGHDTWPGDSWKDRGGTNVWSVMSVDAERGLVFLPLTSPSTDLYGGDRAGAGLFGDSLVALEAATGKRVWHFQTVHHNIWDYDLPAQPNLVTVTRGGKPVAAVAQVTKTGFVFLFDRATGKPLFEIEERPAPKSETPGEYTYPTQPYPVKPPPFTRQSMKPEELTDVTPESRAFCEEIIKDAVFAPLYTPIGMKKTILFPSTNGGANWGGASFDPQTQTLYVNSMEIGFVQQMVKRPEGSVIPYRAQGVRTPNSRFWDPQLRPCQKPPWGFLTAIDLNTGEFKWRSVLGVDDELMAKGLPQTGTMNLGGSIVTAGGLVFIGATNDARFRAFDKDTGKELWVTKLPATAHAVPSTYQGKKTGKQFVVVAAGGGNKYNSTYADSLVAFSLE
ncbi:MAG: pyrroloquinoline quinone-dependent dehydrogenase [Bryobacterales bacterium]|nr:pyrroloquinoline quinone-dependent dehydrogenase [Bryobacterales bacterium]